MTDAMPPLAELDELVALFYARPEDLGHFTQRTVDECPTEYWDLLAHDSHMTVTVERRHECDVDVEVIESRRSDSHYLRKIVLRRKTDRHVVQFGIVRLALSALESRVRDDIMAQEIPLGRVLIQHNVLREVQLNAVWKITCGDELARLFGVAQGHVTYGRTALIYCDGEPAVELLEIVAPEDTFTA